MEFSLLSYKNSHIACYRFGKGNQPVLCFHGYGEEGTAFSFLAKEFENQYCFLAIDLPFHGKTEWKESSPFTTDDLLKISKQVLASFSQKPLLMGFSLGGRVALSLYEAAPAGFQKLVLLAPDGLKVNFWYWFSTQTSIGMKLFSFTMKHPGWFFGFLKAMNKLKLVNASIFKFVKYYIDNEEMRMQLFQRWTGLRRLKPNIQKIKSAIGVNKTTVQLVYGLHDRIILSAVGEKFKKGIESYCTITIIAAGHQVLHEKHAADIYIALRNG